MIKALLQVLVEYLKLRNRSFYYDILTKSKSRQQDLANEIETLRSKPSNDNSDRADLLRKHLITEKQYAQHLSTFYSSTSGQ